MAITASSQTSAQGVIRIFQFTSITNGDTFAGPKSPKAFWLMSKATTVGTSATESSGTYTFYVGATGAGTLFVVL
jgi:hypothetical protein